MSKSLLFGVPQGSVRGQLLWQSTCLHISSHPLPQFYQYADDKQMYLSVWNVNASSAVSSIETCISNIKTWMAQNEFKLNDSKTECLVIRSKFAHSVSPFYQINIGSSAIIPTASAINIGVMFDNTYAFNKHITDICRSIYFFLRTIGHIRNYLTKPSCETDVHDIVPAQLDYGNALCMVSLIHSYTYYSVHIF